MRPKDRTKSKITQRRRTPGGELKTVRKKRTKRTAILCLECGSRIHGAKIVKKLAKTQRSPNRKFGSVLCASCLKDRIKLKSRR